MIEEKVWLVWKAMLTRRSQSLPKVMVLDVMSTARPFRMGGADGICRERWCFCFNAMLRLKLASLRCDLTAAPIPAQMSSTTTLPNNSPTSRSMSTRECMKNVETSVACALDTAYLYSEFSFAYRSVLVVTHALIKASSSVIQHESTSFTNFASALFVFGKHPVIRLYLSRQWLTDRMSFKRGPKKVSHDGILESRNCFTE